MGIVKPFYKVIVPKAGGNFEIQWKDCFNELSDILQNTGYKPFRICIFIHITDETDFGYKSELIRGSFHRLESGSTWPVAIIPQSPEEPFDVAIEMGIICEKEGLVEYHAVDGLHYSIVTSGEDKECWIVGAAADTKSGNPYDSANGSFQKLKLVLEGSGLNFASIVRQWNYVGGILESSPVAGRAMQNYQMFNEVRNLHYTQFRKSANFPAATGIGMNSNRVGIDCFAISNQSNIKVIPISSPIQEDSYHYGQDVLVGDQIIRKQPPQFERAVLLRSGTALRLIMSGTAAIVGQKTVGIGDIELQTKITIDNIEMLASLTNLESHCSNLTEYPDKYSYLRVYVKKRKDISKVKKICAEHFGDVPTNYVQADICRDDLLVEIEVEKMNVINTLN